MKKQTVFSVLLIFLFTTALLISGLTLCERGLQQVSGRHEYNGSFRVFRGDDGVVTVTFAGVDWRIDYSSWELPEILKR